jgi:predicted transcriptional regulator
VRKSKLESFEEILGALVRKPLSIDAIAYKANMDCTVLNRHLRFLIENGLVEERNAQRRKLYAMTERGIAVLKTLNFQKYLTKISNTITAIDEAIETIPIISRHVQEPKRE